MTHAGRLRPILWMGLLTLAMVTLAIGLRLAGVTPSLLWRSLVGAGVVAIMIWLVLRYWAGIDEAAKEVQKSAWLWGGSAGMAAGFVADGVLSLPQVYPQVREPILRLGGALLVGGQVVAIGAVIGFLTGWAIWWGSKR